MWTTFNKTSTSFFLNSNHTGMSYTLLHSCFEGSSFHWMPFTQTCCCCFLDNLTKSIYSRRSLAYQGRFYTGAFSILKAIEVVFLLYHNNPLRKQKIKIIEKPRKHFLQKKITKRVRCSIWENSTKLFFGLTNEFY